MTNMIRVYSNLVIYIAPEYLSKMFVRMKFEVRFRLPSCNTKSEWYQSVDYSGVTLNVARPDMNKHATLGVMLY